MKKACDITDVMTVTTGIMLKQGADFQGVMDVLYPGIMTIGCAAMWETASEEIQRQHPKMREFIRVNGYLTHYLDKIDHFVHLAKMHFGYTVDIEGPHEVSNDTIKRAFASVGVE